ncbi:hypothetical protein Ddye_018938 [Dipteronia dyeriana]|uniref:Stress-response A/B barrel domain-containing protein n=1 Tax=Dipteronia dyeriana TaxID=168575 RepID=A0AAD9WV68_9ROSI|nr:hypothetical protein Ddye_018938 [Dipteronia dyeriana]
MEEAKGVVKHVVLGKFKEETTSDRIDELIKGYANLVTLIEPMKSFHWYGFTSNTHFVVFIFAPKMGDLVAHCCCCA